MTRFRLSVLCVSVLFLGTATASADPVSITFGFLAATSPVEVAPVSVTGTRGFSTRGIADPGVGHLDAFTDCRPCMPGDAIRLGGFLAGFNAAATLDGSSYDLTLDINNRVSMSWMLAAGSLTAPAFTLASQLLETPFTLSGRFLPDSESTAIPLTGRGIASILLAPVAPQGSDPPLWQVNLVHYNFQDGLAATPEPASMTLFGVGVAAASVWRTRRRRLYGATPRPSSIGVADNNC